MIDTGDRRRLSADANVRAHAFQLGAVAEEPGLIHAFRQAAGSSRQRHAHADLRLHIRGEAGVGTSLDRGLPQFSRAHDADRIVIIDDLRAHFLKLAGDALHVLGDHVLHQHVAAHRRDRCQVGSRLDLVGDDGVGAAPQGIDAPDLDGIRARAGDPRAHGVQEVGQIHDVRLLRRVFDDGLTGQQGRRQHDVDGRAHGRHVQADPTAVESLLTGGQSDIFFRLVNVCAQRQKAFDMLVNGAGGKIAAAGQRHMSSAEPPQQRTHQIIAGTHSADELLIRLAAMNVRAVDLHHAGFRGNDLRTHPVENTHQNSDIGNIGNILDPALAADQQSRGQDRHGRVLRAADRDGAVQGMTAVNFISCQGISSPCDWIRQSSYMG